MAIGVVLAGGLATRLPNKPLLPMHNGEPVVMSSVHMLKRSGINRIITVVPPLSAIPAVMGDTTTYAVQPEATGVPHAVHFALDSSIPDHTPVFMTCCDNVYDNSYHISTDAMQGPIACVSNDLPVWKRTQLSRFDESRKKFCERAYNPEDPCIIGWIRTTAGDWRDAKANQSTVEFLNDIKAQPHPVPGNGWWDIGTQEMYLRYRTQ